MDAAQPAGRLSTLTSEVDRFGDPPCLHHRPHPTHRRNSATPSSRRTRPPVRIPAERLSRPDPARFEQRLPLLFSAPAPQPEATSTSDSVASCPRSRLHGPVPAAFPIVLVNRES